MTVMEHDLLYPGPGVRISLALDERGHVDDIQYIYTLQ